MSRTPAHERWLLLGSGETPIQTDLRRLSQAEKKGRNPPQLAGFPHPILASATREFCRMMISKLEEDIVWLNGGSTSIEKQKEQGIRMYRELMAEAARVEMRSAHKDLKDEEVFIPGLGESLTQYMTDKDWNEGRYCLTGRVVLSVVPDSEDHKVTKDLKERWGETHGQGSKRRSHY